MSRYKRMPNTNPRECNIIPDHDNHHSFIRSFVCLDRYCPLADRRVDMVDIRALQQWPQEQETPAKKAKNDIWLCIDFEYDRFVCIYGHNYFPQSFSTCRTMRRQRLCRRRRSSHPSGCVFSQPQRTQSKWCERAQRLNLYPKRDCHNDNNFQRRTKRMPGQLITMPLMQPMGLLRLTDCLDRTTDTRVQVQKLIILTTFLLLNSLTIFSIYSNFSSSSTSLQNRGAKIDIICTPRAPLAPDAVPTPLAWQGGFYSTRIHQYTAVPLLLLLLLLGRHKCMHAVVWCRLTVFPYDQLASSSSPRSFADISSEQCSGDDRQQSVEFKGGRETFFDSHRKMLFALE